MLAREGLGALGDMVVRVYAKKGDNIISLRKNLTSEAGSKAAYGKLAGGDPSCYGLGGDGKTPEDLACIKKSDDFIAAYLAAQVTSAKIAEAKIEAQKLVDLFAIK